MCIHTYVYIYIYIHMCIHTCTYKPCFSAWRGLIAGGTFGPTRWGGRVMTSFCGDIHIHIYIYIYIMYVFICIYIYIYIYRERYICMYICLCIYIYIYIYVCGLPAFVTSPSRISPEFHRTFTRFTINST